MNTDTSFARTIDLVQRAMDVSVMRRDVIANNIANVETPGFKRSEINFETRLKRVLEAEKERPILELERTNPRHLANWERPDYREVEPRRNLDFLSVSKANGNNVDAEQEFMLAMQNQLMYTLYAQAATFEFSQINLALR